MTRIVVVLAASLATAVVSLAAQAPVFRSTVDSVTVDVSRKDGWHDLAVRVTRPGRYDVRARRGYFSTSSGRP